MPAFFAMCIIVELRDSSAYTAWVTWLLRQRIAARSNRREPMPAGGAHWR